MLHRLFFRKGVAGINLLVDFVDGDRSVQTNGVPVVFIHMVAGEVALMVHDKSNVVGLYPQVKYLNGFVRVKSQFVSGYDKKCGVSFFCVFSPEDCVFGKSLPEEFQFILIGFPYIPDYVPGVFTGEHILFCLQFGRTWFSRGLVCVHNFSCQSILQ